MQLNFHQLFLFHTVAKLGSVSRAAEALHISQPSVSAQLREFERRHEVDLLRRLPRGVTLTDAGQMVFSHTERMFSAAEDLQSALDGLRNVTTGQLTIGGSITAGEHLLPAVAKLYREHYPGVEPVLVLDNSAGILTRVTRRELDLGFVGTEALDSGLVVIPCWQDEIVVIAAPESLASGSRPLPISCLRSRPFVMRELGSGTRQHVEHMLKAHNLTIQVAMTVGSPEAVKRYVAAGLGWGFASRCTLNTELMVGQLAIVDIEDWRCRRDFYAVHLRSHTLTQAQERFLEIARAFDPGYPLREGADGGPRP